MAEFNTLFGRSSSESAAGRPGALLHAQIAIEDRANAKSAIVEDLIALLLVLFSHDAGRFDSGSHGERHALICADSLLARNHKTCHNSESNLRQDKPQPI